ncbi:MAG: hypothetical protein GYA21_04380 [Myxococcales bacterium]|nr:hypothetical protein [Myxococcales bacterium]
MTPRALCALLALAAALPACSHRSEPASGPDGAAIAAEPAPGENPETSDATEEPREAEPSPSPERPDDAFLAGSAGDVTLLRIFADNFLELAARERLQAYHLTRAVLTARDIAFDQVHQDGVETRRFLENLLAGGLPSDPALEIRLWCYLKQMWIHGGFFDRLTGRKLATGFSVEEIKRAAALASAAGLELDLNKGEPLEVKLSRLTASLFEPARLTGAIAPPPAAKDDLPGATANLYAGIVPRDLVGFAEQHPRNSRLIRVDGQPFEEVFRAGDRRRKIPPGRYAVELSRVIQRLQDAQLIAPRAQREYLAALIEHFQSGEPEAFRNAARLWSEADLTVEAGLGFLDLTLDARRQKGVFAGMVGVRDTPPDALLDSLLAQWQQFEASLPEKARPERPSEAPRATALQLLAFTGRLDSPCPIAFYLPEDGGSGAEPPRRVVLFSNVIESCRRALDLPVARLLVPPEEQAGVVAALGNGAFILRALREIPGRFLGHPGSGPRGILRGLDETLQAARAELIALWLLYHPRLLELHWLQPDEPRRLSLFWAAAAVSHQALGRSEVLDPKALGQRLALRYLMEKARVVAIEKREARYFVAIPDAEAFQREVGLLLSRIDRMRAQGRRTQALSFIERYGTPPVWPELDAVEKQLRAGGLRRMAACLMPRLIPQKDEAGKVRDAVLSYEESLEQQLLRLRRY